jgi:hypothetical protein
MSVFLYLSISSRSPHPRFNIYIYDYCNKRGFRKTARELLAEAEIPPDSAPPINAKQGLLFESVPAFLALSPHLNRPFQVVECLLGAFHRQEQWLGNGGCYGLHPGMYTGAVLPLLPTNVDHQHQMQQANLRQGSRPLSHQLPQVNRMINGAQKPQNLIQHDVQLPNGPNSSSALGNPAHMQFPMVGAGPQPNGIPTGSAPPGANPPLQNFSALMPGQRQGPPQHRGPNGVNPYQSPTMAHSPQNQGGNPGPNPQNPMNQLGPSPRMAHMVRAGMLPPNANMGSGPPTQTPPFSQLARSPSRPGTPGQVMQRSPSLMDRQTPVNPHEASLNSELSRLPTSVLTSIRQELGVHDKELQSLTFEEKVISFSFEALAPQLT